MFKWQRIRHKFMLAVLCGATFASLQGCVQMAVGSAVVGTMAASDRRTLGAQTEDKTILLKGEHHAAKIVGDDGHVNVTSFNRKVLLTGEVKNQDVKLAVERDIAQIGGVLSVVNALNIEPVSSFGSRSEDTYITGKVIATLVDTKDIYVNSIKTVTEQNVVYLMGRLTEREAQIAAHVASQVGGVKKVVKLFETISEAELTALKAQKSEEPETDSEDEM